MNVQDLKNYLGLKQLAGGNVLENNINKCYIGDLLSWVMANAREGNIWLTVMGNINMVAVAKLAEVSCVILCENSSLDTDAKMRADMHNIPILSSEKNSFELCKDLIELLKDDKI